MKTVIVGGVAAGAGVAARLRRLDESAEIMMFERGAFISYANCGLPYHVGGVIPQREALIVMTENRFKTWFNVDVRTKSEVIAVDRAAKKVTVRSETGTYQESYDKLVLATGSSPVMMDIPGSDDPRVMRLWTIPDMDSIIAAIDGGARTAVVVGAGFIGLEIAENLNERGLDVTLVELSDQVLPTIDKEMSTTLAQELSSAGIALRLARKVTAFEKSADAFHAVLDDGEKLPADLVVMSVGVKPNSELAQAAGLDVGPRGHIIVDDTLQTSDPSIYAAGDVIEVNDPILGGKTAIPLAGPANKQARIVADNLVGRTSRYRGSIGTAVLKVGTLAAGSVGFTERRLKQMGIPYHKIYNHPASCATYYPGGSQLHIKLLFAPDGKILGAQVVGHEGVAKRLDTIAGAMCCGASASELADLELAYAPPFNSAKDPVNFAGMIADNVLKGDTHLTHSDAIPADALILDVREPAEVALGAIPGSTNIPLGQLRDRIKELDTARAIVTVCRVGLRGYLAERILRQNGYRVSNLSGGYTTWTYFHPAPFKPAPKTAAHRPTEPVAAPATDVEVLDVRALACPGPVVRIKQTLDERAAGASLRLLAQLSFEPDLKNWIASTGNELLSLEKKTTHLEAVIRKALPADAPVPTKTSGEHGAALVLFSNDLDKVMAALIIACGMAASGSKVGIFFTFWGLSVLRKNPAPPTKKTLMGRMFGWMLPKGAEKLALSKMNMGGMGALMMKRVMADQNVTPLPDLIRQARELGVRFVACEMAMDVMGITRDELIEIDEIVGVASFVEMAKHSQSTLFI